MNWPDFLHMGGYALYVWTSYGLMAFILLANLIIPLKRRRDVTDKIRRLLKTSAKKP